MRYPTDPAPPHRNPPGTSPVPELALSPSKLASTKPARRYRLINMTTTARILYQMGERTFIRLPDEGEQVCLIDVETKQAVHSINGRALTPERLECLIAEKRIKRRVSLAKGHTFDEALSNYFSTGMPMGEFSSVTTPILIPCVHKPTSHRFAGRRFKRLP